jgi:hypothetical protein
MLALIDLLWAAWRRLPLAWRARVPDSLRKFARRQRLFMGLPRRLTFPSAAGLGAQPIRVVIYGEFAHDWFPALLDPQLWVGIAGVVEVLRVPDRPGVRLPAPVVAGSRTVIVPLSNDNTRNCPPHLHALIPDRRALDTFGNKASFVAFMAANGLAGLCPKVFAKHDEATFPAVLKRADLDAGEGIEIARSRDDLARLRQEALWRGKECVLQAFVPGTLEHVTHCVCQDGRILWHCTFACEMEHPEQIRAGMLRQTITPATASPRVLEQIGRVIALVGYSGPCNVDYKLSPEGDAIIFEINPRFGGSLMMPEHMPWLREALACILDHAATRGSPGPGGSSCGR